MAGPLQDPGAPPGTWGRLEPPGGSRVLPTLAVTGGCDDAHMSGAVLVVDDDALFRGVARRMLVAEGLDVVGEAESVATALAAAHALRPDAVLVDIGLPDGDGISLARQLTALPWRPRVLLTSTDPHAASDRDVRASGAGGFVPKDHLPNAPLERLLGTGTGTDGTVTG